MWKDVPREAMFHHRLWSPPQDLRPWHRTARTGRNISKKVLKFTNSKVITVIATALNVVKFVSHVELFTECEVSSLLMQTFDWREKVEALEIRS